MSPQADVGARYVDIVEVRPPWNGVGEHTHLRSPGCATRAATGRWGIYWRDRNLKFHEYQRKPPTKNVQALLDYIDNSGDPKLLGLTGQREALHGQAVWRRSDGFALEHSS